MPKTIATLRNFSGGINNQYSPRDIQDNEFQEQGVPWLKMKLYELALVGASGLIGFLFLWSMWN